MAGKKAPANKPHPAVDDEQENPARTAEEHDKARGLNPEQPRTAEEHAAARSEALKRSE